jgi:hypothetical protein
MMPGFCVCVPARDEAGTIATLLRALAEQTVTGPVRVALCVNNSSDATAAVAMQAAASSGGRIDLTCETVTFAAPNAHAGSARRAAMDLGDRLLRSDDDMLISTDADCRPPPEWIEAIMACADDRTVIGGRIVLDEDEPLPAPFVALRERFDRYWATVREVEDRVDPSPHDPQPRHGDHTGASLALSRGLYRRAGGVPVVETGEDRALVDAAIGSGGRLVHPVTVWTRTSARTTGRATGGMAADMQRMARDATNGAIPMVPAFAHWEERALWRRGMRAVLPKGASLALLERQLAPMPADMPLPDDG